MSGAESVAAVVVTYNRVDLLERCLRALCDQSRPLDEIIVVDNGSTDGTPAALARRWPSVTVVRSSTNEGPAGGFHAGIARATEDRRHTWLWLFNDDDRPVQTALEALLNVASDGVGMVAGWLLSSDGSAIPHGGRWRGTSNARPAVTGDVMRDVDLLCFSGSLLRTRAVRQVGLPRRDYFMMFEEYEYCLRIRDADWRIQVLPRPLVEVLHAGSPAGGSPPWRGYYQTRNHLTMALERHSKRDLAGWCGRQLKFVAATVVQQDRKAERLRLRLLGTWHALRGVNGRTVEPAGP